MQETALTIQDAKALRRQTIGEGSAVALTALATIFYGFASVAAWTHGSVIIGTGLAALCGGTLLLYRAFLRSFRDLRDAERRRPVFPAARLLAKPRS